MKQSTIAAILLFWLNSTYATTYYVAANGSDGNNGTSTATAFQSIDKVNTIMSSLIAGDQVLFRRGDVFRGQINANRSGTSGAKITFGAYGSGAKPIINGAKLVNSAGWTSSGAVWQVNHADRCDYLFVNGALKTSARYPNTGYLTIHSTNGATSGTSTITNSSLSQAANYWNGARIHVRNQNDALTYSTVSAFSSGTLSFAATGYQVVPNYGFYLDNAENALDTEGEWFWNATTNILKLQASSPPSVSTVEGSFWEYGVNLNWSTSYVVIQDLEFRYQRTSGINVAYSTGIEIQNCTFQHCFNGIEAGGYINTEVQNMQIVGNAFYDIFNNAIKTNPWTPNTTIRQNTIRRNALIAGYEGSCLTCGQAMYLTGNSATISENDIEDCGYAAINYTSANNLVEKNVIKNTGLTKNDCGAIQSWGNFTKNNIIRYNFCSGISGNVEGTPPGNRIIANAIYLDNFQAGSTVENNTCYDSPNATGFFFYSVRYNSIQNNVSYNNDVQFGFAERGTSSSAVVGEHPDSVFTRYNTTTNNIGYCLTTHQRAVHTETENSSTSNFGTFDNNYWFNPYSGTILKDNSTDYTLSGWRATTSRDAQSREHWLQRADIDNVVTIGNNLLTNSDFNSNTSGWSKWQSHVTLSHNTSNAILGSHALQFFHNSGGGQAYGDLQSNTFGVATGTNYILRFRGYAQSFTSLNHRIAMAGSPFSTLSSSTAQALDGTARNYYKLLTVSQNESNARLIYTLYNAPSTIFLDDISLYAYSNIIYDDPSVRSPIFLNPTNNPQTFNLTGTYRDLDNNIVMGSITIPAWSSRILVKSEATLPIELLNFSGKATEGANLLTWATANEVNNKGFEVERSPQPSKGALPTWQSIGFVNSKGKAATYEFTDKAPFGGWGLYRLRQIDNDGKETLSKTISIQTNSTKGKLAAYPNPVSTLLTVENTEGEHFEIINLLGQQVMSGKAPFGGWGAGLDVSALPQGSYFLKVGTEQVKFMKQ
jgi:hypothetical protein